LQTKTNVLVFSLAAILSLSIIAMGEIPKAEADDNKIWKFFKKFSGKADFVAKMDTSQIPDGDLPPGFDRGKTGMAKFSFDKDLSKLQYVLKFEGLELEGDSLTEDDVITKIHFHENAPGVGGPHVLNVFGPPCNADLEMSFLAATHTMTGAYDDRDVKTEQENCSVAADPSGRDGPDTDSLSEKLQALCDGNLYVNVHSSATSETDSKGEIRGQIEPTKRGEKICNKLGF